MRSIVTLLLRSLAEAQRRRARRLALEELDVHTLRDIGLEREAERARIRARRDRLQLSVYY